MAKTRKNIALTETRQTIADRLNRGIKMQQMSGNELAARLKLPKSTISNWRSGKRAIPSDRIAHLCAQLGISPDVLLCGESYNPNVLLDNNAIQMLRWFLGHNTRMQVHIVELFKQISDMERILVSEKGALTSTMKE